MALPPGIVYARAGKVEGNIRAEGTVTSSVRQGLSDNAPTLAIVASTFMWGTLWIPLRQMTAAGLGEATASTASFALCLLLLLPFALLRWRRILAGGWPVLVAGFFMALAIALYAEGMVRGEVARVILLFYLTPVWSSLLGRVMLGEPITVRRVATILLGLSGMLVIFGIDTGIPLPSSPADWMGLAAGITWAICMVYVNRTADRPIFDRIFVQFIFLAPAFYLLTQIPGAREAASVTSAGLGAAWVWLIAFALFWVLPVVWLSIFGGSRLDPGRVAIFLMLEIVIGLTSAALLTDEILGPRELIGAALIMLASLAEFVGKRPARAPV